MASHVDYLIQILDKNELRHKPESLPKLSLEKFETSAHFSEIREVYEELGGKGETTLPVYPKRFDIEFENNIGIFLDDGKSFNKYRLQTLRSPLYQLLPEFPLENYKRFCRQYELDCLKSASHSNFWTNPRSEKYFGLSEDNGDLTRKGSSSWKFEAFQSFLMDISPIFLNYRIIRISVFDNLMVNNKLIKLGQLLNSRSTENYIWKYLQRQIQKDSKSQL